MLFLFHKMCPCVIINQTNNKWVGNKKYFPFIFIIIIKIMLFHIFMGHIKILFILSNKCSERVFIFPRKLSRKHLSFSIWTLFPSTNNLTRNFPRSMKSSFMSTLDALFYFYGTVHSIKLYLDGYIKLYFISRFYECNLNFPLIK